MVDTLELVSMFEVDESNWVIVEVRVDAVFKLVDSVLIVLVKCDVEGSCIVIVEALGEEKGNFVDTVVSLELSEVEVDLVDFIKFILDECTDDAFEVIVGFFEMSMCLSLVLFFVILYKLTVLAFLQ